MNRYLAILLVLSLPQFASAASVSFGAKLDPDGGHAGGSASGDNVPLTGRISWAGNAITVTSGAIQASTLVMLEGIVSRSNDPLLEGQAVTVFLNADTNTVLLSVAGQSYFGVGHVTIR